MSLICVISATGSPGATTVSLSLLASLPTSPQQSNIAKRLLIEANLDGGILGIRYELNISQGLTSLSVADRHGVEIEKLFEHTQKLPGGLDVLLAPDSPELVNTILQTSAQSMAKALSESKNLFTVVDCGRLQPTSPALDFCRAADFVLMVSRPESESLIPASHRLNELKKENKNLNIGWVLIGDAPYSSAEVEETFNFPVFATLPNDKKAAEIIKTGGVPKSLVKSKLMKAMRTLAQRFLDPEDVSTTAEVSESVS